MLLKKENSEFIKKMSYRDMNAIELHAYWGHQNAFKDGNPNCKDFSDIIENSSLKIISPSDMNENNANRGSLFRTNNRKGNPEENVMSRSTTFSANRAPLTSGRNSNKLPMIGGKQ